MLQEKESVFLLDDKRISEINMVSGRTKKRTPKLHPLLHSVVTMASSHNGEGHLSYTAKHVPRVNTETEPLAVFQVCGSVESWCRESFFCGTGIKIC